MRYDENIEIIYPAESKYNPVLGGYEEAEDKKVMRSANITDMGTDLTLQIFQKLDVSAKIFRIKGKVEIPDCIYWDNDKYRVEKRRLVRDETIIYGVKI